MTIWAGTAAVHRNVARSAGPGKPATPYLLKYSYFYLDLHPNMDYLYSCSPLVRGREPVAPARGGRAGVRGRFLSRETHSGGAGAPPGGTRTPRREPADGAKPLALPGQKGSRCPKGPSARPPWEANSRRKRGPAAAKAPDGAPRGATHPRMDACSLRKRRAFRCAVPLFFLEEGLCHSSGAMARRENAQTRSTPGKSP